MRAPLARSISSREGWRVCGPTAPEERDLPAYDLDDVRRAFEEGRFRVTHRVVEYLVGAGLGADTVQACVCALRPRAFHKSQRSRTGDCSWLDIYRPWWRGCRWYVKFVRDDRGDGYRVLTICRDGEKH